MRALAADWVFDDLHRQRLAFKHLALNRDLRLRAACHAQALAIGRAVPHISHVQEGRTLQPNVYKGRLHARQHPRHAAQVHIAHQATLQRALDMQLLHGTAFDDRHTGFLRRPVDQNVFLHGTQFGTKRSAAKVRS